MFICIIINCSAVFLPLQIFIISHKPNSQPAHAVVPNTFYAESIGDKSNTLSTFKGTSGIVDGDKDYRNSKYQKEKDKGLVPEGTHTINLIFNYFSFLYLSMA